MKNTMKKPVNIPVEKLHPFEEHPFKVKDDEEMNTLIESVQTVGILSPLIVRPIENTEEYEVISGHLNTRGKSLLAGNVFCGHCVARLTLTTNGRCRKRKDGSVDKTPRIRYVCYGKTRKQIDCDGQTGYTMSKLDGIVEQVIKNIFGTMKGIPKSKIVSARYKKELADKKRRLADTEKEYNKALQKLNLLKAEIIKCLQGESSFSKEILSELIEEAEKKCTELGDLRESVEKELKQSEKLQAELCSRYDEIIS